MSDPNDDIDRWTARRKATAVIDIWSAPLSSGKQTTPT
jgi:hypothetical protein